MRTADFDYLLPGELIAQAPAPNRADSRLLVLSRKEGAFTHRRFSDLPELMRPGDLLVLNDSRVMRARLRGMNERTGGQFEMLLLEKNEINDWWVMLRPGKRARGRTRIQIVGPGGHPSGLVAEVVEQNAEGHRRLVFSGTPDIQEALEVLGEVPLPPYIKRGNGQSSSLDIDRYQTVYAQEAGSVAAPTAGLHFTPALLQALRTRGVEVCFLTLHVGLGTFAPVKTARVGDHVMHEERFFLPESTVEAIQRARADRRRVMAVGTTTVRVLESVAARHSGRLQPGPGRTRIFIHPPYRFEVVDALLTNFHLPRSTLLMLVSAFAEPEGVEGRRLLLSAYRQAVAERYRFFSYGDAMLVAD